MIMIIAGSSRSGKTSIAKTICREYPSFSYLPCDAVISTLEELYPENGIRHLDENEDFSPRLAAFIRTLCSHLSYEGSDFILDLYQLYPVDYLALIEPMGIPIVYIGYPHLTAEKKLPFLRAHQRTEDWTASTPDDEMLKILEFFITEGKEFHRQCEEHHIPFFDTGDDFTSGITDAVSHISSLIENT